MKKLVCVLLCLMLILPSALADTGAVRLTEGDPAYEWLYEKSMALAAVFNEALHSNEYITLYSPELEGYEELALLQMQDFSQPLAVTIVRADDLLSAYGPNSIFSQALASDYSPALMEAISRKLYTDTSLSMLQASSMNEMIISTVLTVNDAYVRPAEIDGPCYAIMFYGGLYAFVAVFFPTENGIVYASATFIPSRSADELNLPVE